MIQLNAIDKLDEKYQQAIIIFCNPTIIFVPNPDDDGAYLEIVIQKIK